MAHFSSKRKSAIISTSFKVMWSSLKRQPNLKKLKDFPLFFRKIGEGLGFLQKQEHYLLVRNPYKRLESFFKDKFRKNVPVSRGQTVHRLFYPVWGITKEHTLEEIHQIIRAYSFESFINELPNVFNKDPHLYPQFWVEFLGFRTLNWRTKFTRILKMEKVEDIDFLSEKFELDLNKNINSTNDVATEIIWTTELKSIVKNIYKNDFDWYDYNF
jgi:hypothetical protein